MGPIALSFTENAFMASLGGPVLAAKGHIY